MNQGRAGREAEAIALTQKHVEVIAALFDPQALGRVDVRLDLMCCGALFFLELRSRAVEF